MIDGATTERGPLVLDGTMFVKERYLEMQGVANSLPLFWEAAVFALVSLFTLSELREGDRHPKVNTPLGIDWRILVISHPLCRNIKVQWRQTGTNHHSTDSQT